MSFVSPGRTLIALAICLSCCSGVNRAFAQPLSIVNPGFEANSVSPGCFQVFLPSGWSLYDPNGLHDGNNDAVGGLYPEGSPYFPAAPEGHHVALVFMSGDIGGGPMGLSQTLAAVLEVDSHYTLSVQVGNIASGTGPPPCDVFGFFDLDNFPGYRVQLLAGGVVIAEDNNSLAGSLGEGEFGLSTVEATIGAAHPQLGQSLQVQLINLNVASTPQHPGIEVDFDDVRLERSCARGGDIDGDSDLDAADVALFVDVLLGVDTDPIHVSRADVDCSGTADGADVHAMIDRLL